MADVSGADHVERRRGRDRVDVNLHLAAADQPGFLDEIVVEVVLDERGTPRRDRLARATERVVLVAAAADRADGAAVGEDEHLRADPLRRRADGADDRHERRGFTALERGRRGGQDLIVHPVIMGILERDSQAAMLQLCTSVLRIPPWPRIQGS